MALKVAMQATRAGTKVKTAPYCTSLETFCGEQCLRAEMHYFCHADDASCTSDTFDFWLESVLSVLTLDSLLQYATSATQFVAL